MEIILKWLQMLVRDQTALLFSYIQPDGFPKTIWITLYWSDMLQKHFCSTLASSRKIKAIHQNDKVSFNVGSMKKYSQIQYICAKAKVLSRITHDKIYREMYNKYLLVYSSFFKQVENPDYVILTLDIEDITTYD